MEGQHQQNKEDLVKLFDTVGTNFPEFSLAGLKTYARVISIYDGDTITLIMPFAGMYYKFPVRVNGIDTCEIKSKNAENRQIAFRARNRLFELVTGSPWTGPENATKAQMETVLKKNVHLVWIECDELDKYGRVLGTVRATPNDQSFADILVASRLAYHYGGATKLTEEEQLKLLG